MLDGDVLAPQPRLRVPGLDPPNAIVFGTARVPLTRMIRAGVLLDLACLLVLWVAATLLGPWLPRAGPPRCSVGARLDGGTE